MLYYDPSGWIDPADHLIPEVEEKLKLEKKAGPRVSRAGKSYLPPNSMELGVLIKDTNEMLRLAEWVDKAGKVSITLSVNDEFLRQGHFNHDWHHNPNGIDIPPPHHIHFPTKRYPNLRRSPTYAYRVKELRQDCNYLDALQKFCSHTNIEIRGAPLPLLRR